MPLRDLVSGSIRELNPCRAIGCGAETSRIIARISVAGGVANAYRLQVPAQQDVEYAFAVAESAAAILCQELEV